MIDTLIEPIGFVGNILLACCSLPLVYDAMIHKRNAVHLSFLNMWFAGEILAFLYATLKFGINTPLSLNYLINIAGIMVLYYYQYLGGKDEKDKL